jgi:hypothetical protein
MALYATTVLDDVITALEGITVANGYNGNLLRAERFDRYTRPEGPPPFATVRRDREPRTLDDSGEFLNTLQLVIDLTFDQDQDSSEHTDELQDAWIEDVSKALLAAFNAVSAKPNIQRLDSVPFASDDPDEEDDGVQFTVTVAYYEDEQLVYRGP